MNPLQVIRNEFFHLLGTDHIAVDQSGTPIARSTTRASVEQAAPNAAAYFSATDFVDLTPATPAPVEVTFPEPVKVMPSAGLIDTPRPGDDKVPEFPNAAEIAAKDAEEVPSEEHPDADKLN